MCTTPAIKTSLYFYDLAYIISLEINILPLLVYWYVLPRSLSYIPVHCMYTLVTYFVSIEIKLHWAYQLITRPLIDSCEQTLRMVTWYIYGGCLYGIYNVFSSILQHGFIRHTVNKITFSEQCYYVFGDFKAAASSLPSGTVLILMLYHKAGNFKRENFRELVENKIFTEKSFVDCSLVSPPKDTTPPILQRKLSWIATKPRNLQKFSPSKVSCYAVLHKAYCSMFWHV